METAAENNSPSLNFEYVAGGLSHVEPPYTTLWRKLPFHMCRLSPEMSPGSEMVVRLKNQPEIVLRGAAASSEKISRFFQETGFFRFDFSGNGL